MIYLLRLLLLSSLSLLSSHAFAAADAQRGEIVAAVRCSPCHDLHANHVKVGPTLLNIYGRKPSIVGVPFDVWDEASLQLWLLNPRAIKANTKMWIPKLSERDRNDIVAWFKSRN